jgi:hypothetical protein
MGGFRPDASSRIPVMALAALTALNGSVWPNLEDGPKVALAVLESLGPSFQVGGPIGDIVPSLGNLCDIVPDSGIRHRNS